MIYTLHCNLIAVELRFITFFCVIRSIIGFVVSISFSFLRYSIVLIFIFVLSIISYSNKSQNSMSPFRIAADLNFFEVPG